MFTCFEFILVCFHHELFQNYWLYYDIITIEAVSEWLWFVGRFVGSFGCQSTRNTPVTRGNRGEWKASNRSLLPSLIHVLVGRKQPPSPAGVIFDISGEKNSFLIWFGCVILFCSLFGCPCQCISKGTQQKHSCSLVLKVKKWAALFFRVLTGIYNTVYCLASSLFFLNVPGTIFNARHQVKAIAIGVSEVNPLVEIGDCCSCVHLHVFFPTIAQNRYKYKGLFHNPHFYMALYSRFYGK